MRIASFIQDSIVDGPGLRFCLFVQGCKHHCLGCHNQEAQDPNGGSEFDTHEIIYEMLKNPLTDGLTLSGGEPFDQAGDCAIIAQAAKERGLNVWVFSGYCFEELFSSDNQGIKELLSLCDVLVDGRFELSLRSLSLKWRGSENQRVLDLPKSLSAAVPVLWEEPEYLSHF